jgi:hypothetical protein
VPLVEAPVEIYLGKCLELKLRCSGIICSISTLEVMVSKRFLDELFFLDGKGSKVEFWKEIIMKIA